MENMNRFFYGIGSGEFYEKINNMVNVVDLFFQSMLEIDFLQVQTNIDLYNKIQWPPCLDLSKEKQMEISDSLNIYNSQDVVKIILEEYNDQTLNMILERWRTCDYLKKDRFIILKEAMDNYICGRYNSCVVLNSSQYGGIIKDIELYLKEHKSFKGKIHKIKQIQTKELKDKGDRNGKKNVNSEKNTLERNSRALFNHITCISSNYFSNYIFCNNPQNNNHPNRHKILHGEDCEFGTQEKALKTILCVDILIRYYVFMENI